MTDHPIIFSGPMVRAILEGRKTQTRRVMPDQTLINASGQIWTGFMGWQSIEWALQNRGACGRGVMPNFSIGDRLWVREQCATWEGPYRDVVYRADETDQGWSDLSNDARNGAPWKRRSARYMPRWASRLTLIVEDVRVQRLQEISARDSIAEGVECQTCKAMLRSACGGKGCFASMVAFRDLWDSLNAGRRGCSWSDNPWICAVSFHAHMENIDAI